MSRHTDSTTKNTNDSRKQALQALISSLAPNGTTDKRKLGEEQLDALSDRLTQLLGDDGEGPEVRRNEKGELLNEDGLPIIDISEPVNDASSTYQTSEVLLPEQDLTPLWSLSDQERLQMRARRDRLLDMLEEEESNESGKDYELERLRQAEELAKMDAASKAAAREMQKRMGKALLRNLAAQREKEEEEKKKAQESEVVAAISQNGEPTHRKPKKRVSFANVPEVDEVNPKSKPSVAWGDVSVVKLRSGMPKAELRAEVLNRQPMKLEVVERIAGQVQTSTQELDSDDESNPEENAEDEEHTPSLEGDFEDNDSMSTRHSDNSEEDEYDLSQAKIQREVALEYIRLRESIGAEAHQAMTSHIHGGEDEWDQPEVPLDASLSSRPAKRGVSRFKSELQANLAASGNTSISLGTSVLPQGKSHTIQKAVRIGKSENGKLVGGEEGESDSEHEENENVKPSLEMLRAGIVDDSSIKGTGSLEMNEISQNLTGRSSPTKSASLSAGPSEPKPGKTSRFLAERASQKQPSERVSGPSLLADTVVERPASKGTSPLLGNGEPRERDSLSANAASRKPPVVISVPSVPPPEQHRPFARPLVPPDPAVLKSMIVESPSFPPPGTRPQGGSTARTPVLVDEVRESTGRAGVPGEPVRRTGKISRFMAERS